MPEARSSANPQRASAESVAAPASQAADDAGGVFGAIDWEVGVYRDHLVAALGGYPELQDRVRRLPAGGPYYTLQDVLEVLPPARDQETPALTEEEMDLLPDEHSEAVAEDEAAPALSEEALDLQPETAEERERGEPAPALDETAEDLRGSRSDIGRGEGETHREEEGVMSQNSDRVPDVQGGIRRTVSNVTGRLEDLGDRVEDVVESGVKTSLERVAGRERAEQVVEQLDKLEDRAEETVEQAAARAQAAVSGVAERVETTTSRVSPTQRVVVLGLLVGVVSGFFRWTVRRLTGRDLAWLGPAEVRPVVLGVGLAGAAASALLPEQSENGKG